MRGHQQQLDAMDSGLLGPPMVIHLIATESVNFGTFSVEANSGTG